MRTTSEMRRRAVGGEASMPAAGQTGVTEDVTMTSLPAEDATSTPRIASTVSPNTNVNATTTAASANATVDSSASFLAMISGRDANAVTSLSPADPTTPSTPNATTGTTTTTATAPGSQPSLTVLEADARQEKEDTITKTTAVKADVDASQSTPFDCNICFDLPNDPVVTACGHLYCWPCLYRWMRLHAEAPQCPVCKSSVERHKVIPIYGRGRSASSDPRLNSIASGNDTQSHLVGTDTAAAAAARASGLSSQGSPTSASNEADASATAAAMGGFIPPRPQGQRDAPPAQRGGPHDMRDSPLVFRSSIYGVNNATYGGYGNLSLSTFGLFPSLFGMQIAYPHMNDPPRDVPNLTAEQETEEQVSRVFLFLTFFIMCCISFF